MGFFEDCHGPGSLHASNQNDQSFRDALMPWRKPGMKDRLVKDGKYDANLLTAIDKMCQQCHDVDNDVNYKFEKA